MSHVLITGMSGVGKSAVSQELRSRGHSCIDMDEPGWSYIGSEGHQHWNRTRLEDALDAERAVFVVGCAEEQADLHHRFRAVILLSAPRELMLARIQSRTNNLFGQDPADVARILNDLDNIEPMLRKGCTYEIVTTVPVEEVVNRILELTR